MFFSSSVMSRKKGTFVVPSIVSVTMPGASRCVRLIDWPPVGSKSLPCSISWMPWSLCVVDSTPSL